jgi:hypothetical protein
MKKLMIVALMLLLPVFFVQAQTETCPNCPLKAGQEVMKDGCPKKRMNRHKMMMQELMGMMKDSMRIQQNVIQGAAPADKKAMIEELSGMMNRIDTMTSTMKSMTGTGMKCDKMGAGMKCDKMGAGMKCDMMGNGKMCDKPCDGCEQMGKCDKPCNGCKKMQKEE